MDYNTLHRKYLEVKEENKRLRYELNNIPIERDNDWLTLVCQITNVTRYELFGRSRKTEINSARMCAMWLMFNKSGKKYTEIARLFNRNHSTVIHAVKQIENSFFWKNSNESKIIQQCLSATTNQ